VTLLKLALGALRPYWYLVLLVIVFQAGAVAANLYLPTINASIIDDGVAKGDIDTIWTLGGWMLLVTFGNILAVIVANFAGARAGMQVGRDLRSRVFDQVATYSQHELNQLGTPSLITRSTNDVQQVQMLSYFALNILVQAPVTGILGIVLALRQEAGLAWLIAVLVPVMLVGVGFIMLKAAPLFRKMQVQIDAIARVTRAPTPSSRTPTAVSAC
jgi:ATP-binding cassette subfamily B protein